MGQEASLPQANGDEEFEHQARAPPSSSNPPPSNAGSSQQQQQQQQPNTNGGGKRPSAKIMNAVFPKRQQQQQHNAPVDLDPSQIQIQGGGMPSNSNMQAMTPEQQQQYYHQQQIYHQQMQQQQQQQQQQQMYYAQHGGPQQQQQQQQQYNPYAAQSQMPSPNPELDGIMYEHDRVSPQQQQQNQNQAQTQTQTNNTGSKKGGFMRSNGRGAAIINSMKNLSLGSAMQRASPKQPNASNQQQQQQQQPTVNDWETKWDEDDDDSDGDDEDEEIDDHGNANHGMQPSAAPLHPPMRPGIDPTNTPGQQPSMSMPITTTVFASPQPSSKSHLVTATPDQDGAMTVTPARPTTIRQDSEDGLEWDTGALADVGDEDDRPNVQMFLPLLRVLGKGSFGKVSESKRIMDFTTYDMHHSRTAITYSVIIIIIPLLRSF
jgi:hypothetical protein